MKKIFFPLVMLTVVSISGFCQPSQGSLSIGGTFSVDLGSTKNKVNSNTTDGPKTTYFSLIPSVEYFILDKLSAGVGIGYSLDRSKTEGNNTTTISSTGTFIFNPFARYYLPLGGSDKVSLFGQGDIYLGLGNEKNKATVGNITNTDKYKHNTISFGISPGVAVYLSQKISIEATFGFIGFQHKSDETGANDSEITNDVIFSISPSYIGFGLRYFLF
jgi:outer membrane protein